MKTTLRNMIIAGGTALVLAACGTSAATGTTQDNSAPAGAASGTAVAGAPAGNRPGPGGRGGGGGTVTAVNGSVITVQGQGQQNTSSTVTLTNSTKIFKPEVITLSNIAVGDIVNAAGTLSGDVLTAQQVRIITADEMTDMMQPNAGAGSGQRPANGTAQPNAGSGQPPANGTAQPNGAQGNRLLGTVTQVASDTVTVKKADGSTDELKLAANGRITKQVVGTVTDITIGERLRVIGARSDTTVTATQIDIIMAPTR